MHSKKSTFVYEYCVSKCSGSVMDSAPAELLASDAWRNICATFLLLVLPPQRGSGASLPHSESMSAFRTGCQISAAA